MKEQTIAGVTIMRPFVVLEEEGRGGPAVSAATSITGQVVVQVIEQRQERQELVIRCPRVSWQERHALEVAMASGRGPFWIESGARRWLVAWQDRTAQRWTPAIAWCPDVDWTGAATADDMRECSAELRFWVLRQEGVI